MRQDKARFCYDNNKKTTLVILNFKFALPAPILSLHHEYHQKKATPSIPPNLSWIPALRRRQGLEMMIPGKVIVTHVTA